MQDTGEICQAAIEANSIDNIEVSLLCASCAHHSKEEKSEDACEYGECDEGHFSTDAHDSLKRYSYEHRQAVVAASAASTARNEKIEEAKKKEEAEAKNKGFGSSWKFSSWATRL
jgi:hypothetical protein